ncbi:hypothetical protein D3C72_2476810 [compost metagenome]
MIRPQLDVAIPADRQEHHGQQDDCNDQDVEPTGIAHDPALHRIEQGLRLLGCQDREPDQQQRENGRRNKHRAVNGGWSGF